MNYVIANAGFPTIMAQVPLMVLALIPTVLIEGYVILRATRLTTRKAFTTTTVANLASTFVGIPLAWVFMYLVAMATHFGFRGQPISQILKVVLSAAWADPGMDDHAWKVHLAMLVMQIPAFVLSVLIERWVFRAYYPTIDRKLIGRAVLTANAITYALLCAMFACWLAVTYGL